LLLSSAASCFATAPGSVRGPRCARACPLRRTSASPPPRAPPPCIRSVGIILRAHGGAWAPRHPRAAGKGHTRAVAPKGLAGERPFRMGRSQISRDGWENAFGAAAAREGAEWSAPGAGSACPEVTDAGAPAAHSPAAAGGGPPRPPPARWKRARARAASPPARRPPRVPPVAGGGGRYQRPLSRARRFASPRPSSRRRAPRLQAPARPRRPWAGRQRSSPSPQAPGAGGRGRRAGGSGPPARPDCSLTLKPPSAPRPARRRRRSAQQQAAPHCSEGAGGRMARRRLEPARWRGTWAAGARRARRRAAPGRYGRLPSMHGALYRWKMTDPSLWRWC
jgi:hypothetical protein